MKRLLTVFVCVSILIGCGTNRAAPKRVPEDWKAALAAVDAHRKSQAESRNVPYEDNVRTIALITSLDDRLAGFVSDGNIMNYEIQANGLGYSKGYNASDKLWTTVYAYHLRMKDLKNGIKSEALDKAYQATVAEIKSMEGRKYSDIETLSEKDVTIEGVPFKRYVFKAHAIVQGKSAEKVTSEAYITVYGNVFLKVRASYLSDYEEGGDAKIIEFMSALVNDLKKSR